MRSFCNLLIPNVREMNVGYARAKLQIEKEFDVRSANHTGNTREPHSKCARTDFDGTPTTGESVAVGYINEIFN